MRDLTTWQTMLLMFINQEGRRGLVIANASDRRTAKTLVVRGLVVEVEPNRFVNAKHAAKAGERA